MYVSALLCMSDCVSVYVCALSYPSLPSEVEIEGRIAAVTCDIPQVSIDFHCPYLTRARNWNESHTSLRNALHSKHFLNIFLSFSYYSQYTQHSEYF